jgi:hypothetical protein
VFFASPRDARIAGSQVRVIEFVVSFLSIMSIAGITVARFGIDREKNSVASLSIWCYVVLVLALNFNVRM